MRCCLEQAGQQRLKLSAREKAFFCLKNEGVIGR